MADGLTWIERDAARVWHGFTQMAAYVDNEPIVVERAEGRELIDIAGRRYLDAISSLWVTTLGHRVSELDAAVVDQLGRVAHSTMLGHGNRAVVELAEALAAVVPVEDARFLFASDGASAVEQAIRIAFQHWVNRGRPERRRFLALGGAYHGDTLGALSLGDGGFEAEIFAPLRFPVLRAPAPGDPAWADGTCNLIHEHGGELAAVVIEPLVQGAAGMRMGSPGDFARIGEACAATGTLLICDEIATGFGRTGSLFASATCGLRPDLLCLGKGLTGGYLPMSVTVASRAVQRAFDGDDLGPRTLFHGHSYGGNALAAAVALRHLDLVTRPAVLDNVRARSEQLRRSLTLLARELDEVLEVRLQGLMGGVEMRPAPGERRGRRICAAAVRRGVLLRPLGEVIVLVPPLTVTAEEVDRIVRVLEASILEVTRAE